MENPQDSSNMANVGEDTSAANGETGAEGAAGIPSAEKTVSNRGIRLFFMDIRCIFKLDELGREVARIALPAALALAADPLASLADTAFIGRLGFLLLARVIAATICVTMAASLAAHHGSIPMAAFQICLQVWLATSLLADGLAVAGQAILASAFAKGELQKVMAATSRVLQLSVVLGLVLTVLLGLGLQFGAGIFTKDINVKKQVHKAIPFVAGTQTINSLAFVFDGVNFGASDYYFSAISMVVVAAVSIPSLIFLSGSYGFIGIWTALTIYMTLQTFASVLRLGSATGPWTFL